MPQVFSGLICKSVLISSLPTMPVINVVTIASNGNDKSRANFILNHSTGRPFSSHQQIRPNSKSLLGQGVNEGFFGVSLKVKIS